MSELSLHNVYVWLILIAVVLSLGLLYFLMIWAIGKLLNLTSSSIGAVAKVTFDQAIRMKIAVVVFFLLVILLPLMSVALDGDGTLLGKLQTFGSYGLGLIGFFLSILTIAVSSFTLSNDIKRKHLFLIISKPIHRWEFVLGKLVGVILLNVVLLSLFSGIVYACTLYIPNMPGIAEAEKARAEREFFTSRIGYKAEVDKDLIKKRAQSRYEELAKTGQVPEGMSYTRFMKELSNQEMMKEKKVSLGEEKVWEFKDIRVKNPDDPKAVIFLRFQYQVTTPPPDDKVYGMWTIGDLRPLREGLRPTTYIHPIDGWDAIRVAHEYSIPAKAIAKDGYLGVALSNHPSQNGTAIIPEDIEVLYQAGSFTGNYFRVILLMFVQLIFLAMVGISLSTWLSFPVAILFSTAIYFTGLVKFFIIDAIDSFGGITALMIYSLIFKPILWFLPHFDQIYSPSWYIVDSRTLPLSFLFSAVGFTICIKGLLVLFFGMLIFSRREVANAVT